MVSEVASLPSVSYITGGGVDYDSGPYNVTFPAGITRVQFDVPINDDMILEGDESFALTVSNATLVLTIMDNESKKLLYSQIAIAN